MDCIFCKIAKKEISAEVVYEDRSALAFLDIRPMAPGHTVVVPKRHVSSLLDMPKDLVEPFFSAVQKVAGKVFQAFKPDGLSFGINQGRAAGQHVDHLHFHIVPRWQDDGGGSFQSIVHNPPREDIKTIAEKIRNT